MKDSSNKLASHFVSSIVYAEDDQKDIKLAKKKVQNLPTRVVDHENKYFYVFHCMIKGTYRTTVNHGGVFGLRNGEHISKYE